MVTIPEVLSKHLMLEGKKTAEENALALHEQGDFQKSLNECIMEIARSPSQAWCYHLLGLNMFNMGRKNEAIVSFRRFLELDRSPIPSVRNKVRYMVESMAREK
jgi:tetratricopeptide (TPR) repeat protein